MSKDEDRDHEEREREDTRERLEEHRFAMPLFTAFMAASMAAGNIPAKAAGQADLAMAELKKRFA